MDRALVLRTLARENHPIPAGQAVTAAYFEASDGPGVARLFYSVYGDGYPIDTYYIPERLIEENRLGNIRSVVARTESGDVVAHVALYRSSPPNPRLFEHGVGLTHPAYRSTLAFFRASQLLMNLVGKDGVDAFFGETVCNHTVTQKLARHQKVAECAIEPALMPAEAYLTEQSAQGRVGCLVFSQVKVDCPRIIYIPEVYREQLAFILNGFNLDRELRSSRGEMPIVGGELQVSRFSSAGVARCRVSKPGRDLDKKLDELETALRGDAYALVQVFIDLGESWSGEFVEMLRKKGYSFGGIIPLWFGSDALLLQKFYTDPGFGELKILTDRGRSIVELAQKDWETQVKVCS